MELLLSNFPPIKITPGSTREFIEKNLTKCKSLKIATGYISSDALIELKRIIELNKKPKLELLIGMHYFDGFTPTQLEATKALNEYLTGSGLGFVHLSNSMKFHGKMYSFTMDDASISAIVGSSNLGSIFDKVNRQYEADIHINGTESIGIHNAIERIIKGIGCPFENIDKTKIKRIEFNRLLENHENVEKVDEAGVAKIKAQIINTSFDIPVKTEPKSNLNAFFGKGRVDQRGYEMPRPWYEAEIIVSKKTTSLDNYPADRVFTVVTDDGWSFKCETNGDNSKNFRTKDDLKILGKWLKGRMEEAGALEIGKPVTEDVLRKYGRNSVGLTATKNPDVWYLDFSSKK